MKTKTLINAIITVAMVMPGLLNAAPAFVTNSWNEQWDELQMFIDGAYTQRYASGWEQVYEPEMLPATADRDPADLVLRRTALLLAHGSFERAVSGEPRGWIGYTCWIWLACLTHYYSLAYVLGHVTYVALRRRELLGREFVPPPRPGAARRHHDAREAERRDLPPRVRPRPRPGRARRMPLVDQPVPPGLPGAVREAPR